MVIFDILASHYAMSRWHAERLGSARPSWLRCARRARCWTRALAAAQGAEPSGRVLDQGAAQQVGAALQAPPELAEPRAGKGGAAAAGAAAAGEGARGGGGDPAGKAQSGKSGRRGAGAVAADADECSAGDGAAGRERLANGETRAPQARRTAAGGPRMRSLGLQMERTRLPPQARRRRQQMGCALALEG